MQKHFEHGCPSNCYQNDDSSKLSKWILLASNSFFKTFCQLDISRSFVYVSVKSNKKNHPPKFFFYDFWLTHLKWEVKLIYYTCKDLLIPILISLTRLYKLKQNFQFLKFTVLDKLFVEIRNNTITVSCKILVMEDGLFTSCKVHELSSFLPINGNKKVLLECIKTIV